MSNIVFGRDVVIAVNPDGNLEGEFIPVVCAVSCGLTMQNEIIGKTDRNAGFSPRRRARQTDCSMQVAGLLTLENEPGEISALWFMQEQVRRTELAMQFLMTDETGLIKQITGFFLVEGSDLSADTSAFGEFELSFVSTGAFNIAIVDPPSGPVEPICEVQDTLYLTLPEGESSVYSMLLNSPDVVILWVSREGLTHDQAPYPPGNRQFTYIPTGGEILFDQLVPGGPGGEAVSVGYKIVT